MTKRSRYIAPRIGKDISLENAQRLVVLAARHLDMRCSEVTAALFYSNDVAPGVPDEFVFNRALQGEVARTLEMRNKMVRVPGVYDINSAGMSRLRSLTGPELAALNDGLWDASHPLHRIAYTLAVAILRFLGRWQGE